MDLTFPSADHRWPFAEPEDTEVIVLSRILRGESPLRLVTHDADDGAWQFLDGGHVLESDAEVATLGELAQFDPSILSLAPLSPGQHAWRPAQDQPWRVGQGDPDVTLFPE